MIVTLMIMRVVVIVRMRVGMIMVVVMRVRWGMIVTLRLKLFALMGVIKLIMH
jgi:hypothetical protein